MPIIVSPAFDGKFYCRFTAVLIKQSNSNPVSARLKNRHTNVVFDDNIVTWNGLNISGQPVSSGIYIYTYESSKERGIGKFTVISVPR